MKNLLYKITNNDTGEVVYAMNLSHVCMTVGCNTSNRYYILKNGKYKNFDIKEIDGSKIPYGEIFKP